MILKVKQNGKIGSRYFSLILEKPKGFNFYPGQYLDIALPVKDKLGNTRSFTISSSPTERFLMITTKIGATPYKKFMENIKAGDTITSSHPAGTFTLDESTPAVFLAGGIGITPFRSMIRYALDKKLSTPITLIYSDSGSHFIFKEELDLWQDKLPNLRIIFNQTSVNGRLNKTKLGTAVQRNVIFYLAGSDSFVNNMKGELLQLGVDKINIRTDRFDGY